LVAPALALLLSFFIKYFELSDNELIYSFYSNENIPQYLFIAVIVAIFLGLTTAAEEINKDKKILARESFLNLSRQSYLLSKVSILFIISAIQSGAFTLIGNLLLEVDGMFLKYWLILFSTSFVSNIMGLTISSAFNSAKVIYIVVPLLIIPQLLFSGVIVKFDKLHPALSDATKVPWLGNLMVSRWAYEGLAVEQVTNNELESLLLDFKCKKSKAQWKKDYWLPQMKTNLNSLVSPGADRETRTMAAEVLINEIENEDQLWTNLNCNGCLEILETKNYHSADDLKPINEFLDVIKLQSIHSVNKYSDSIQRFIDEMGDKDYNELKHRVVNENLEELTMNRTEQTKIIQTNGRIYQNDDPIYNDPVGNSFLNSHFYAPFKYLFGYRVSTYWANLIVIWIISILSYLVLYFDLLKRLLDGTVHFYERFKKNR
jgi:hypothetical protein